MEELWEDLLRRVYYAGYEDHRRELYYDPMDHKTVEAARIRAEKMEKRVRMLESTLQLLMDVQNGCPLPKYEADWRQAMADGQKLLEQGSE